MRASSRSPISPNTDRSMAMPVRSSFAIDLSVLGEIGDRLEAQAPVLPRLLLLRRGVEGELGALASGHARAPGRLWPQLLAQVAKRQLRQVVVALLRRRQVGGHRRVHCQAVQAPAELPD